jgi:hypothetical protein
MGDRLPFFESELGLRHSASNQGGLSQKEIVLAKLFDLDKYNGYFTFLLDTSMKLVHIEVLEMLLNLIPSKYRPKKCRTSKSGDLIHFVTQKDKLITFNLEEGTWVNQDQIDLCHCRDGCGVSSP